MRIALVDNDPLSRHFLILAISDLDGIDVCAVSLDDITFDSEPQVVVLASVPELFHEWTSLEGIAARGNPVVILGTDWTERDIRSALKHGASGILIKSAAIAGFAPALRAVIAGYTVMSPELSAACSSIVAPAQRLELDDPGATTGSAKEVMRLLDVLTWREVEVLCLLSEGLTTSETAARLGVSLSTIKSHVSHVLSKLCVRNRVQAVVMAKELRLAEFVALYPRWGKWFTKEEG